MAAMLRLMSEAEGAGLVNPGDMDVMDVVEEEEEEGGPFQRLATQDYGRHRQGHESRKLAGCQLGPAGENGPSPGQDFAGTVQTETSWTSETPDPDRRSPQGATRTC
ncbi:unnamed protein product [Gadus morhua 'NCC']